MTDRWREIARIELAKGGIRLWIDDICVNTWPKTATSSQGFQALADAINNHVAEALAEAVAAERKDADRYRWLRADLAGLTWEQAACGLTPTGCADDLVTEATLDAAIDAVMIRQQPAPDEAPTKEK